MTTAMYLDSLENAGEVKGYRNWADLILQAEKLPVQTSFVTGEKITAQNRFAQAAMMKHADAVMACKLALNKANELYDTLIGSLISLRKEQGKTAGVNGRVGTRQAISTSGANIFWVSKYQEIRLFSERPELVVGLSSIVSVDDIDAVTKMFVKSLERLVLSWYSPDQQQVICQQVASVLHILSDIKALLASVHVFRELAIAKRAGLPESVSGVISPAVRANLMVALGSKDADSIGGDLTMVGGRVVPTVSNLEFVEAMAAILQNALSAPRSIPPVAPVAPVSEVEAQAVVAPVTPVSEVEAQAVVAPVAPVSEVEAQAVVAPVAPVLEVEAQAVVAPVAPVLEVEAQAVVAPVAPVLEVEAQAVVAPVAPVLEVEAPAVVAPVSDALVVTGPDQTKLRWSRNQKLFAGVIATILAVCGARKVMNRPTPAGVSHVVATRAPTAPIITTPLPVVSASPARLTVPMVTDVAAHVPAVSLREIQRTCATTNRDVSFPSCVKALLTDARISLPASLLRECGIPGATTGADLATYQRLLGRELYRGAPWHLDHVIAPADQRVRVSWPQGNGCTDMTVVHEVKTAQGWSMPAGHRLDHVNGSFGHLMPATR